MKKSVIFIIVLSFTSPIFAAQILCIGENCAKRKVEIGIRASEAEDHAVQPIGDIVGVFEDSHVFSSTEQDVFQIIQVDGFTRAEVEANIPVPEIIEDSVTGKWEWRDRTDREMKELKKKPKFLLSIANLTIAEKNILESKQTLV